MPASMGLLKRLKLLARLCQKGSVLSAFLEQGPGDSTNSKIKEKQKINKRERCTLVLLTPCGVGLAGGRRKASQQCVRGAPALGWGEKGPFQNMHVTGGDLSKPCSGRCYNIVAPAASTLLGSFRPMMKLLVLLAP